MSTSVAAQSQKVATDVNRNEISFAQATRRAPESTIHKMLDYLMYYNSGKELPFISEFIKSFLKNSCDSPSYKDAASRLQFFELSVFLTCNKDWCPIALEKVLRWILRLETNCAKADQYAKSVTKWVNVKMFIVLQIGIAILREMLNLGDDELPDDPSNLIVPLQFNSSEYEERMEKLFTKFESLYKTKSGKHRQKYTDHICTLTAILNAVPENEDKSHDARINVQGTHFLLSKNRLRPTVTYLFRFIQSMETTFLPIPQDVKVSLQTDKAGAAEVEIDQHIKDNNQDIISDSDSEADYDLHGVSMEGAALQSGESSNHPLRHTSLATHSATSKTAHSVTTSSVVATLRRLKRKYDKIDPLMVALGPVNNSVSATKPSKASDSFSALSTKSQVADAEAPTPVSNVPPGIKHRTTLPRFPTLPCAEKRTRWTLEQEAALAEAVSTYGEGSWAEILSDLEYSCMFAGRSNVNLKDKWRNMCKRPQDKLWALIDN